MDDRELLAQAAAGSHEAFERIVRRHVNWVYSAARRQVRDPHLAEDVAQAVFLILFQKVRRLGPKVILSGWLLQTTRYAAANALKMRGRRRNHEGRGAAMTPVAAEPDQEKVWGQLSPVIDESLLRLPPRYRDAIVLRFYEERSLKEIGDSLGVSEQAARKVVSRAVEKLRGLLTARGVTLPAATIGSLIATHSAAAAPAHLAGAIASGVVEGAVSGVSAAVAKGAVTMMALAKAKLLAPVVAVMLLAAVPLATPATSQPQPATRPAVQPATMPARPTLPIRRSFDELYRLDEGEVIKHIPPPFIPERLERFRQEFPTDGRKYPEGPQSWLFHWDGQLHSRSWGWLGPMDPQRTIKYVLQIPLYKVELPALPKVQLEGDWIIRADAEERQKLNSLADLLADQKGELRFEQRQLFRDVLIVSGIYGYTPLDESKDDRSVHFFAEDDLDGRSRGGIQKASVMLRELGEWLGLYVIDQTEPTDAVVSWRAHESADLTDYRGGDRDELVNEVLDNVARQTGLQFRRERREVPVWVLVEVNEQPLPE